MHRLNAEQPCPLHDVATTRRIEQQAALALPEHTLMQRAGQATARLALALAPHAKTIWIACGPGNNGGDGLEAAACLSTMGKNVVVSWLGDVTRLPADAQASLRRAQQAKVRFVDEPPTPLNGSDLCIDALLGIGSTRAPEGDMARWIACMNTTPATVLAVDLPSGLDADHGSASEQPTSPPWPFVRADHTLSLLTVKPGLFTALGRDAAGQVWFESLNVDTTAFIPIARLHGAPQCNTRWHASHKGSYGDVAVLGGEGLQANGRGTTGAAILAGTAALHAGAGRVIVSLLDGNPQAPETGQPELMLHAPHTLDLVQQTVVCGCGGGQAVRAHLPLVLSRAHRLVLDADALNAIAADEGLQQLLRARAGRGHQTVLTPHPLEAARLLGRSSAQVQFRRLDAALQLADQYCCTVALKGSGTVIASLDRIPEINPTGNALLACAGTGDVLAGTVGALMAQGQDAHQAAANAVWWHGRVADLWPADQALTAGALARRMSPHRALA